jgi:hypothetical protein
LAAFCKRRERAEDCLGGRPRSKPHHRQGMKLPFDQNLSLKLPLLMGDLPDQLSLHDIILSLEHCRRARRRLVDGNDVLNRAAGSVLGSCFGNGLRSVDRRHPGRHRKQLLLPVICEPLPPRVCLGPRAGYRPLDAKNCYAREPRNDLFEQFPAHLRDIKKYSRHRARSEESGLWITIAL